MKFTQIFPKKCIFFFNDLTLIQVITGVMAHGLGLFGLNFSFQQKKYQIILCIMSESEVLDTCAGFRVDLAIGMLDDSAGQIL